MLVRVVYHLSHREGASSCGARPNAGTAITAMPTNPARRTAPMASARANPPLRVRAGRGHSG